MTTTAIGVTDRVRRPSTNNRANRSAGSSAETAGRSWGPILWPALFVIANHAVIAFTHRAIAFFPQELPFFQIKPDLRLEQQGQDGQDETW